MKKKLCSLSVAVIVLLTSAVLPLSASAEIAPLEPFELIETFDDESIIVGENYTDDQIEEMTDFPLILVKDTLSPGVWASIIQEEDGNKMIEIFTSANADTINSSHTFAEPMASGEIEASFDFAPSAGNSSGAWTFFNLTGASGGTGFIEYRATGWAATDAGKANGQFKGAPQKNQKGMYSLMLKVSRSDSGESWKVEIYDKSGDSPSLIYEGKTSKDFGAIAKLQMISLYSVRGFSAAVDNYSIKATPFPAIVPEYDGLSNANPSQSTITVRFNGAIPNPDCRLTLEKVSDPTVVIETETTYNEETGEMTIAPQSYLEYDTEYKAIFGGGGVTNHTFRTANANLLLAQKTVTYTPQGSVQTTDMPETGTFDVRCDVTVSNKTTEDKRVTIMLIAYGENGAVLKTDIRRNARVRGASSEGGERTTDLNREILGLDATKIASVDVVVWEEVPEIGYRPVE